MDCQIILVNVRQRFVVAELRRKRLDHVGCLRLICRHYADEIESRLRSFALRTSIIVIREGFSLTKAIENATRQQCLYAIIVTPIHEERRTASFHILYGQTEGSIRH